MLEVVESVITVPKKVLDIESLKVGNYVQVRYYVTSELRGGIDNQVLQSVRNESLSTFTGIIDELSEFQMKLYNGKHSIILFPDDIIKFRVLKI